MKGDEMSKNKPSKQVPKPATKETQETGEVTKDLKKPAEQPAEPEKVFVSGSEEEIQAAIDAKDWNKVRELRYGPPGIFKPGKKAHKVKSNTPSV